MLLRVPLTAERHVESGRKRKRHDKVQPGSVVEGTVIKAHPLYVDVQLADGGALPLASLQASTHGTSNTDLPQTVAPDPCSFERLFLRNSDQYPWL